MLHCLLTLGAFKHRMTLVVLLGSPDIDPVSELHEMSRLINHVSGDTSLYSNIPCMQVHVASLDSFDTHRSKSSKIVGEAN